MAEAPQILEDWKQALDSLADQVEAWAKQEDWATRRAMKTIDDPTIGSYSAPMVLLQQWDTRILLEPISRYVMEAEGRVDFYLMPQYDDVVSLIRKGNQWYLWNPLHPGRETKLTQKSFRTLLQRLTHATQA